jgi:hypothetical protein
MTTKQISLIFALILLACMLVSNIKAQQDHGPSASGRYVLTEVEFLVVGQNGGQYSKAVFKIDTATGATWQYESIVTPDKDGKYFIGWVPLKDAGK